GPCRPTTPTGPSIRTTRWRRRSRRSRGLAELPGREIYPRSCEQGYTAQFQSNCMVRRSACVLVKVNDIVEPLEMGVAGQQVRALIVSRRVDDGVGCGKLVP